MWVALLAGGENQGPGLRLRGARHACGEGVPGRDAEAGLDPRNLCTGHSVSEIIIFKSAAVAFHSNLQSMYMYM